MTVSALAPYTAGSEYDPIRLIEESDRAPSTKALYVGILRAFLKKGYTMTDPGDLQAFAATLTNSRKRTFRAALSVWVKELINHLEARVTPETLDQVQATIMRLHSLPRFIKARAPRGQKEHTWLSPDQVKELYATCSDDRRGLRDKVVLGLMITGGLRRGEIVKLKWSDIVEQPHKGGSVHILNVEGKGRKRRSIPLVPSFVRVLDQWAEHTGRKGYIIQGLTGRAESLTTAQVHNIVKEHGKELGTDLSPHDLRRTAAQSWYQATRDVNLVSVLLGHSSIATTQRYLTTDRDAKIEAVLATAWGGT